MKTKPSVCFVMFCSREAVDKCCYYCFLPDAFNAGEEEMVWLDCGLGALLFCTGYAFLSSLSYFQLLFSTVWVFVLNQLVPLKANEL